jgi:hypothetical protein
MSRAGCCCGGQPEPGDCCVTEYIEQGRKYQVNIKVGSWPGSGLDAISSVGSSTTICSYEPCPGTAPVGECPYRQPVIGAAAVTTKITLSWGGGNGIYLMQGIKGFNTTSDCTPCFAATIDPGMVNVYTEALVPDAGVQAEFQYTESTSGTFTTNLTWQNGTTDVGGGPSISATLYRGNTRAAPLIGCNDDAPCDQGLALIVTAKLPRYLDIPCMALGIPSGLDVSAIGTALFYGCRDQDNRYYGESRYATREFNLNRVDDCDAVGVDVFSDGVFLNFGTSNIDYVQAIRPIGGTSGDPCDGTYSITYVDYQPCTEPTSYTRTISSNLPSVCPSVAGWYDPIDVPHPFPLVVEIVRLAPNAPTITNSTPGSGPAAGGTVVTISGTNFIQVTDVHFGANRCAALITNSSTSMTVAAPPGTAGTTVSIIVTTDGGTATRTNAFTYT